MVERLGPWLALVWGVLGAAAWAFNGIFALTGGAQPALSGLLFTLALTVAGVSIGMAFTVLAGMVWLRHRPGRASAAHEVGWMIPMGVGLLGLTTGPLFLGWAMSTIDWVVLAAGSLASGFVVGTTVQVRSWRLSDAASDPVAPPITVSRR